MRAFVFISLAVEAGAALVAVPRADKKDKVRKAASNVSFMVFSVVGKDYMSSFWCIIVYLSKGYSM